MFQKFGAISSTALLFALFFMLALTVTARQDAQQTTLAPPAKKVDESKKEDREKSAPVKPGNKESADNDWPLFRGNGKSTGVAFSKLPDKLDVIWTYEVKKGAFESTPIVVKSNDQKIVVVGDLDGKLYSLDLESGKLNWEFKTISVRESEARGKSSGGIGFETAPAFRDEKFFIGDLDGFFYCIDSDGKEVWQYQTDGVIHSSANFYKDAVLFGSEDTKLYALNPDSGKKKWELETADQVRCSVTVVDGRAFVAGCDGALHTIDLDKGKEESSVSIDSPTGVTPAVVGDTVFVGTEQAGFFAIDWKETEIKWHFNPDNGLATRSSPAVNKDHIVFGSRGRVVYSLDPKTGKQNWSRTLKANIDSSPVIVGKRVFVGSTDGRLYGLSLEKGDVLWEKQFQGGIVGSPAVAFDRMIIATDRGVVYCLGKK